MKTLAKCSNFTPVGGKLTAVLIAAFLAALSEASLAQPPANASSAIAWVQQDAKGDRYVYYLKNGSPYSDGQPLTNPVPPQSATPAGCRWTPGGIVC
jgi:hypothetical protein